MLKFKPNKNKSLTFDINVEGIDPQLLEYNLRLSNGQVDYGIKGEYKNGEVQFDVPPLNEIVNSKILNDLNEIKLEVNDKNNKYYLKPFEDEIKIDKSLKVEAKLNEPTNEENEIPSVNASLNETKHKHKDKEESDKEKKKKTKFSEYLGDK